MPHAVTTTELRSMQVKDLLKEIDDKRTSVAKMSMGVRMQSEKDTAKYRRERRELARMLTILGEKKASELNTEPKNASVPAPSAALRQTQGKPPKGKAKSVSSITK